MFSPSEVPDLHDLTGKAFEERYEYYEALAQYPGKIKLFKTIQAKDLWRKMLSMLPQTLEVVQTRAQPIGIDVRSFDPAEIESLDACFGVLLQYPGVNGVVLRLHGDCHGGNVL